MRLCQDCSKYLLDCLRNNLLQLLESFRHTCRQMEHFQTSLKDKFSFSDCLTVRGDINSPNNPPSVDVVVVVAVGVAPKLKRMIYQIPMTESVGN